MPRKPSRWLIRWYAKRTLRFRLDTDAPQRELTELPPLPFRHAFTVIRLLRDWLLAAPRTRSQRFPPSELATLEEEILTSSYDLGLRDPLSVIVGRLSYGAVADSELAWACLCAAQWAQTKRLTALALFFSNSAAAASDAVEYYLIAEMMAANADLAKLIATSGPADRIEALRTRLRQLAEMVAAEGALVSLDLSWSLTAHVDHENQ